MTRPRLALVLAFGLAALQPACVTKALLKLGEPGAVPDHYDRASRVGDEVTILYDSEIDNNESRAVDPPGEESHRISKLAWSPLEGPDVDPGCTPEALAKLAGGAPVSIPVIGNRSWKKETVLALHAEKAAGSPPMTLQLSGRDFWIICGSKGHAARGEYTAPEAPKGKSGGAIAAIVILFPFALVADICGGFIGALGKSGGKK